MIFSRQDHPSPRWMPGYAATTRVFVCGILCLLIHSVCLSQGVLEPEWVQTRGSVLVNGTADAWGVDVDENGDVFWAVNSENPGFLQGLDIEVFRLDAHGNEVWSQPARLQAQHTQQIYVLASTDSVVYAGGRYCTRFTLDPELPFCDMLVLSISAATGDTLWSVQWDGGFGYDEVDGLIPTHDGLLVSGWSQGENTDMDVGFLKIDADGNVISFARREVEGRDHQDGHSVLIGESIYVGGLINGPTNPGLCLIKDFNGQAWLAQFSRDDFSNQNQVSFGRDDTWCNFENTLGLATDGVDLYAVGITTTGPNNNDLFVARYDTSLRRIWYRTWGGSGTESARAVVVDTDGVYIGGNTTSFGAGGIDFALLKYSLDGDLLVEKTWGMTEDDQILDISLGDRVLYLTGKSQDGVAGGRTVAKLLKVDLDRYAVSNEPVASDRAFGFEDTYPNPFSDELRIVYSTENDSGIKLALINLLGQEVNVITEGRKPAGRYMVRFDGTDTAGRILPSGVYLVRLTVDGKQESKVVLRTR